MAFTRSIGVFSWRAARSGVTGRPLPLPGLAPGEHDRVEVVPAGEELHVGRLASRIELAEAQVPPALVHHVVGRHGPAAVSGFSRQLSAAMTPDFRMVAYVWRSALVCLFRIFHKPIDITVAPVVTGLARDGSTKRVEIAFLRRRWFASERAIASRRGWVRPECLLMEFLAYPPLKGPLKHRRPKTLEHDRELSHHCIVRDPHHVDAMLSEDGIPPDIVRWVMLRPIHLHHQAKGRTIEIHDEPEHEHLTPELFPDELASP
jgi:hypothetical protein